MTKTYKVHIACALIFVFVLIMSASVLVGCEDSDVLKEIVYSQESEIIDHNNTSKVEVESEDAKKVSTKAKPTETSTQASDKTQSIARVEYSSKPSTNLPVPKYIYAKDAVNDSEASEPVSTKKSEKKEENEAPDSKDNNKDDGNSDKDSNGPNDTDKKGNKADSDSDNSKDNGGGEGKGSGKDVKTYNPNGIDDDMPSANTVAAYGQYAVIVQMLAGEGALVAYDEETASSKFAKVFKDEGASNIATVWSSNAEDGNLDVKALIKADPDTILVDSGAGFSKSEKEKLADADISITTLPSLTSATRIKTVVKMVGKILADSNVAKEDASSNAESYCKYHDKIIEEAIDSCGGYAAYNNIIYDADASKKPHMASSDDCRWTVLINDWDYSARYKGLFGGKSSLVKSSEGVGIAQMGYTASPVSYYLGAGGVINNAAAKVGAKSNQGKYAIVWQFETSKFKVDSSEKWNSAPSTELGELCKIDTDSSSNLGSSKVLLNTPNDGENSKSSEGLGSKTFPAVIVTSEKMKKAMAADSKTKNGIYTAYDRQTLDNGVSGVGIAVDSALINSAIKTGADLNDCILVNPEGLLGDWTSGCAESFLESVWASSRKAFGNNWNGSFKSTIKEFYKTFYRYDLTDSDFADIEDGVN